MSVLRAPCYRVEGVYVAGQPERQHAWFEWSVDWRVATVMGMLRGAGPMVRTLQRLMDVDLGFATEGLATLSINFPWGLNPGPAT